MYTCEASSFFYLDWTCCSDAEAKCQIIIASYYFFILFRFLNALKDFKRSRKNFFQHSLRTRELWALWGHWCGCVDEPGSEKKVGKFKRRCWADFDMGNIDKIFSLFFHSKISKNEYNHERTTTFACEQLLRFTN